MRNIDLVEENVIQTNKQSDIDNLLDSFASKYEISNYSLKFPYQDIMMIHLNLNNDKLNFNFT